MFKKKKRQNITSFDFLSLSLSKPNTISEVFFLVSISPSNRITVSRLVKCLYFSLSRSYRFFSFRGEKMQTRYMERTNSMREKRKLEEDDDNNNQQQQQPERKRPALAR